MADAPDPAVSVPLDETPAQRQARIRRTKREAKITSNAGERLDKITRLSGRTPESLRRESPVATPPRAATPSQLPSPDARQSANPDPEQLRLQEEYLRSILRQPLPQNGAQDQTQPAEDPMMKMLQAMMGNMSGDPNDPNAGQADVGPGFGLSPDDLSKATGLPSFVTDRLFGGQKAPPTKAEIKATRFWRVVHVIFAIFAGMYLIFSINKSTQAFGENPPAPATFQNPFVVFATGELLLQTTKVVTKGHSGRSGTGMWLQMLRDALGDGSILVFALGLFYWWKGSSEL